MTPSRVKAVRRFGPADPPSARRVFDDDGRADERWALTELGYAYGSRRSIDVSPMRCPVGTADGAGSEGEGHS